MYYTCTLKLVNCLQQKASDILLTTFFRVGLLPYLWVLTIRMKKDTLFQHKEATIICEENLGDVFYRKLLEPLTKKIKLIEQNKHKSLADVATNGMCQGVVSLEPR